MDRRREFAKRVARATRALGYEGGFRYDAGAFSLSLPEAAEQRILNLHTFHGTWKEAGDRAARRDAIEAAARAALGLFESPPERFDLARPFLLPGVRPRSYFAQLELQFKAQGVETDVLASFPHRPLGERLVVTVDFDTPIASSPLNEQTLEGWEVSFELALELAILNLRARSDEPFEEFAPGAYTSRWGDHYDASRLLIPDRLEGLGLAGRPVAMAAHRAHLLVAGSEDRAAIDHVLDFARQIHDADGLFSAELLQLGADGAWSPFRIRRPRERAQAWRTLLFFEETASYARQSQLLQALVDDEALPDHTGYEDEHGRVYSLASLVEWEIPALLPKVDRVRLVPDGEGDDAVFVTWYALAQALGDDMSPCGLEPERYLVTRFPDPDEVREIVEESAELDIAEDEAVEVPWGADRRDAGAIYCEPDGTPVVEVRLSL